MSYPYVQASNDYGTRKGPVLGFVVHMAEGGGTVGFLSRPNPRGVSVHYVIEYSGRIVQMLAESHASGSINPGDLRRTEGPDPYGISVAIAVLGVWVRDPNSAVITVEIEGFARDGPRRVQLDALAALITDVRTRYPRIGLLGHRDFVDYKACPGSHIPWDALGGHGPASTEDDMPGLDFSLPPPLRAGKVSIPEGTEVIRCSDSERSTFGSDATRQAVGPALRTYGDVPGWLIDKGGEAHWVPDSVVRFTENVTTITVAEPVSYVLTIDGTTVAEGSTEA